MTIDEGRDRDQPDDGANPERDGGDHVVVEGGQRGGQDTGDDLGGRSGHQPGHELGGGVARLGSAGERVRDAVGPGDREHDDRDQRDGERSEPGRQLAAEAPVGPCKGEAGKRDHTKRACDQHQREVDGVGGEEAVGLYPVPKLPGENDAGDRGRAADGRRRDPRHDSARDRSPST